MKNFKVNNAWTRWGRFTSLIFGLMMIFGSCVENIHEGELDDVLLASAASGHGVSDGAHGGMEGFYFLPPMVQKTDFSGEFDPTLSPVVEISDDFSFNYIHAQFTMDGSGPDAIKVAGEHYHVNWSAGRTGATAGTTYRIRVRLGNMILGYADVAVVRNGSDMVPDGLIRMNANQTLPIKFRIEKMEMVQPLQPLRIELTWMPYRILDSHLTGPMPGSDERFHIAYWNRGSLDSPPFAFLDYDDVTGEVGETTYITQFFEGTYRFYVHHYTHYDDIPFRETHARVRVFRGDELLYDFEVPQSEGYLWTVFELDGTTGTITPINQLSYEEPWEIYRLSPEPLMEEINLIFEAIQNNPRNQR